MEKIWYLVFIVIAIVMAIYLSGRKIPMPKWTRKEKVSGKKGSDEKGDEKKEKPGLWDVAFVLCCLTIIGIYFWHVLMC